MVFPTSVAAAALLSTILLGSAHGQAPAVLNSTETLTGFPPANLAHVVHLPSSPLYSYLVQNGSWATPTKKEPWCFVLPTTTDEVSKTITALNSAGGGAGDWHIAMRSGGHGSDDSNSMALGVTIDLSSLNSTTYDAETQIASVGTGARWLSVYQTLEEEGVSVTGGREGVVGVGGLLISGGISWYTARTGFACDSVVNYEVVLASGEIVNANASANADLWRALKGGGSNYGVVTRFDLETFPAQNLTIQRRPFGLNSSDQFVDAFVDFTNLDQSHAANALISIVRYNPETEESVMELTTVNTVNDANSSAYEAFDRIPALSSSEKQSLSLAASADRAELPGGLVNAGAGAIAIVNDRRVLHYCFEQYNELIDDLKVTLGPGNFSTIMDFQPFPSYIGEIGVQKGRNVLGVDRNHENRVFFVASVILAGSDAEKQQASTLVKVSALNERVRAFSQSVSQGDEFIYLAYARARQDPLGSYGAENVEFMKCTAKKYDPEGFFQHRVPGGFKIHRVQ